MPYGTFECFCRNVARGIVISIQQEATSGTEMRPHAQRFLDQRSARTTLLARVVGCDGDHYNMMQSPVVSHPLQEHAPSGIRNALSQLAVPDHVTNLEVFIGNHIVRGDERVCLLSGKIFTLPMDLEMRFGDPLTRLFAVLTLLLRA